VDTEVFSAHPRTHAERLALWKRRLVDDPRGWRPGCPEGSIRYHLDDLSAFTDGKGQPVPVVLFAGRFMRFKRLQLLIEAHHAMRSTTSCRSVLVVAGGFPCEWEGEHPYDTVQRLGAVDVFFVGWLDHEDLSEILNCSDVFAAPAVDEPFGLVYLEAMAAGLPPIATSTGGPLTFINVDPAHPTGWLVPPDDVAATARALAEAVSNQATRVERGRRAAQFIRRRYSWASSAEAFGGLYAEVVAEHSASTRTNPERPTIGVA
jgi:glycosyltransferase involved in cell wall biosynthesis